MQTNCILEGEGQCFSKLYRIASCGRGQNSTDTKQGSGQTTSARGMVGVVDVTTVQEYTGATHRLHTADLAPAVSTACCFHSPVSSLVYLLFLCTFCYVYILFWAFTGSGDVGVGAVRADTIGGPLN